MSLESIFCSFSSSCLGQAPTHRPPEVAQRNTTLPLPNAHPTAHGQTPCSAPLPTEGQFPSPPTLLPLSWPGPKGPSGSVEQSPLFWERHWRMQKVGPWGSKRSCGLKYNSASKAWLYKYGPVFLNSTTPDVYLERQLLTSLS